MNGQKLLDNAIFYERRKNWKKAILFYKDLFELFKDDISANLHKYAPDEMKILKFQCFYHCGVAHQNVASYELATSMFERGIKEVEKRKNGCSSCITGRDMHWSVPAHAKKAVSQIYLGNLQDALLSSEKALLLDNANPDMYCIRGTVRLLLGDMNKAIADVTRATKFNPRHVCALIVRGWIENSEKSSPLSRTIRELHKTDKWNEFEEKAYELNPFVVGYFGLADNKEKIIEVLDKHLPTVRCPHTITVYDVLRIAQARCNVSQQRSQIIKTRNPSTSSATRQTSLKTKYSTRESSESSRSQLTSDRTRTFLNSGEQKTETNGKKTSKERTELTECCKGCSSVEEFLKHLIWSEDTNCEN